MVRLLTTAWAVALLVALVPFVSGSCSSGTAISGSVSQGRVNGATSWGIGDRHLRAAFGSLTPTSRDVTRSTRVLFRRATTAMAALQTVVEEPSHLDALTPIQIKMIRKEVDQRRAARTLTTVFWNDTATDTKARFVTDTNQLQHLASLLHEHHLVQMRGISLDNVSLVKSIAERLARDVEMELTVVESTLAARSGETKDETSDDSLDTSKNSDPPPPTSPWSMTYAKVFVVEIVGHAATLYTSPRTTDSFDASPWLQLRTTGKSNAWDKRPKAPRDNRGQIIR